MRSDTRVMYRARQVSNLGGFMSGVNNNGAHSANGITALFIATGQDAANVAESSAAFVYSELRENGDYYYSATIPSLIVVARLGDRRRRVGRGARHLRAQPLSYSEEVATRRAVA
jgi:hydroxymethylglutaryl-CoA reductase